MNSTKAIYKRISILFFAFILNLNVVSANKNSNQSRIAINPKTKPLSYNVNIGLNYTTLTRYYDTYDIVNIRDYINSVRAAHTLYVEALVYYKNRIGIGIGYDYYSKKGYEVVVDIGTTVFPNYSTYRHDIIMHTISPTLYVKTPIIKKVYSIILSGGIDVTNYINPYFFNRSNYEISGKNYGYQCGISNEFDVNNYLKLGLNLKYRNVLIDDIISIDGSTKEKISLIGNDKINLNRISVGVFLGIK
jgi:hypothetical protein